MRWLRNTRGGSYVVEAVLVIPIFLVAVLALLSVVPMTASCEDILFSTCDELRLESAKAAFRKNPAALPAALTHRIQQEEPKLRAFRTVAYRYLYADAQMEDLLQVRVRAELRALDPLGLTDGVVFDGTVTARAFTGTVHKTPPDGSDTTEPDPTVYIFPEWGSRYHSRTCTYVQAACRLVYLSQETMRDYAPCKVCNASSARIGSPVFCFSRSGAAYHLAECRMVQRYYVETGRQRARAAGYTACSKCGGGDR